MDKFQIIHELLNIKQKYPLTMAETKSLEQAIKLIKQSNEDNSDWEFPFVWQTKIPRKVNKQLLTVNKRRIT